MNFPTLLLIKVSLLAFWAATLEAPAIAQKHSLDHPPIQISDRRLSGQCRQVNRQISVYEQPSRNSDRILLLEKGYEVILAEDEALKGWVYISEPEIGFIETAYLTACGTFQVPDSLAQSMSRDLCINDQVSDEDGLPIYTIRNTESTVRDRVFPGERITVLGVPIVDFNTQVEWLQIDHPFAGWIVNSAAVDAPENTGSCE